MHYYSFNIGDYRRRTNNFTLLEHGIYRQLIDEYYLDESPLPIELKKLYRKIGAKSEEEKQIIKELLEDFFTLDTDGYQHVHCNEVIAEYHAKSLKNKENGKKGGRPKKNPEESEINPVGLSGLPIANPNESESNPNQEPLTINNKPVTNKIPYQLIADAYQKYYSDPTGNGGLVAVKQWSAKRKGAIKKLWLLDTDNELENNQTNNIEHWERYFDYCSSIAFFQGDASRNDDHANWKASFDFLIKVDTYNANKERKYS